MPLSPGDKLGPYEIVASIGKGGMGEVYRAHDPRLKRDVAIKVSPAQFSERFEREAQAIAALNHSNICQLYDVGPNYLVMEYIEGTPLKGPLPVDQAVRYATQICDALDAAHKNGITHRDLKPANIMITPDGVVKVLDFGLAAVAASTGGDAHAATNSPTFTMSPTSAGMIMGTAPYMSPEQARGNQADRCSDIFSFGVVLYEMLTGRQLFHGETVSDILASMLKDEPNLESIPEKVRPLLKRCLEKDPKKRLQAIGDWDLLLSSGAGSQPSEMPGNSHSRFGWGAAVVFAIVAAGTSWIAYRATRPAEPKPLMRLDVDLGADVSLGSFGGNDVILSPDGMRLVYVSQNRLFSRRLDQLKAVELTGPEGAFAPFFSPDGQWVAFSTVQGPLKKISVEGGSAITLCNPCGANGGSWGEDGNVVVASGKTLTRIRSAGGAPTPIAQLDGEGGEASFSLPQILPGGRAVLFTAQVSSSSADGANGANIEVMSFADHRRKTLVRGGSDGRYLPSGHLVYMNGGTMFAAPFDVSRLELKGTPAPVLEQIGAAQIDFSKTGMLVYRSGGGAKLYTAQWLDSAGKTQPLLSKAGPYGRPRLSPNGRRLVLEVTDGSSSDVWVYDWQRDTMTRLTFTGKARGPAWSPDGRYIIFWAVGAGMSAVRSDGAGKPQLLIQSKNPSGRGPSRLTESGWRSTSVGLWGTTSGRCLSKATARVCAEASWELSCKRRRMRCTPHFPQTADGWPILPTSRGTFQIYVRAFPDKGGKWQISNSSGRYPLFSRSGRELFFLTTEGRIMIAAYTADGDSFVADKPRPWSEQRIANIAGQASYDIAPDGKRIVALTPIETPEAQHAQNHVILVLNFFDELRRKMPSGR